MNISEMLTKPLWQLTGEEYLELHTYACLHSGESVSVSTSTPSKSITGVRALAQYLSCCDSTLYALMRDHILDDANISRIGKCIVFDGDKARMLANNAKRNQRKNQRKCNK